MADEFEEGFDDDDDEIAEELDLDDDFNLEDQ